MRTCGAAPALALRGTMVAVLRWRALVGLGMYSSFAQYGSTSSYVPGDGTKLLLICVYTPALDSDLMARGQYRKARNFCSEFTRQLWTLASDAFGPQGRVLDLSKKYYGMYGFHSTRYRVCFSAFSALRKHQRCRYENP
ncbi:hypothetical protein F5Y18DRAFT_31102 [Xylariaceae sp. FL1019]|nr:hypothetical protein F5Y18DRAFT_31102 [Xylariaceae sp. FL1019]